MDSCSTALALGGGGARGLAHLGVIESLLEAEISLNRIVGVSIGSLAGAMYAFNPDIHYAQKSGLEYLLSEEFQRHQKIMFGTQGSDGAAESTGGVFAWYSRAKDYLRANRIFHRVISHPSLLPGLVLRDVVDNLLPDADIADAVIPLSIVAVDLRSGHKVILERGSVREAVRASSSLPGIFPPVEFEGMLLSDVGVFYSLPTTVARSYGMHQVVAVSTTSLAGGGIGRTHIDWLLDGRRYRGFFIGHFRILELLGTGSTGWLYEAEDTRDGSTVVLKVLSAQHLANAGMRARFDLESRAALEFDHPNIIRAIESGSANDAQYLVMEVAYGATLQELIELNGPVPCAQACDIIAQAARGLQHIHEAGIIHRDIKPANLLLLHDGELKIIDFGLALIRGDADELTLKVDHGHDCMGTPDYIPPEQARDSFSVDATADIYSLGCTLYFALTGEVPFPHNAVNDKLKAHREHAPQQVSELVSDVPQEVSDIVSLMMAKDCNERFQTAAEVAQALKPFAQRGPVYFDFHKLLAGRAATAKKRMFLLANHDISRPVTNTNVKSKTANANESSPAIEPELAGS